MSLNFKKSISLTGESVVGDKTVVVMNATVAKDQPTSYSQYIADEELYRDRANRVTVRADIDAFSEKMYAVEDSFIDDTPLEPVKEPTKK